jgi:hypothetical protein
MSPRIGRNDRCPCGSGLKYKLCHGGPRAAPPQASADDAGDGRETAVERALRWLTDRHRKAVQVAVDDLLSEELWPEEAPEAGELDPGLHEMLMINLFEWLLAEGAIQIKGQRCNVNRYVLGADGPTFSATERQWIEQLAGQQLRLYTITEVWRGEGLTLVDALDEMAEPLHVQERASSQTLRVGMLIGCRVMALGDRRMLSGAIYPFPMLGADETLAAVRAEIEDASAPANLPHATGLAVARAWVRRAVLPPPLPTMVDSVSGDPLLLVTDHYRVLDADALACALAACGDVVSEGVGEWRREREFDDGLTRSLAVINRGKQADRIEVFYRTQRLADEGRSWFEGVAGGTVRHLTREIVDPRGALRHAGPGAPKRDSDNSGLPPEALADAIEQVLLRSYANWADEPIPALGGKTPREAIGSPAGLERVKGLLRSYEDGEEDMARKQGRRPISYQFLWDALGIAR